MSGQESYLPEADGIPEQTEPYPIGFKVAVGLTAVYLLWRLAQGVTWLLSRILG